MDIQKVFNDVDGLSEKYKRFLADICAIESPTSCKEGVDNVGKYIIARARELGWDVDIHKEENSGDVFCITMNKDIDEKPLVFSSHMDTVHPLGLFGEKTVQIDGNIIHAPGAGDCKGGFPIAFAAMEALDKNGYKKRPLMLIAQSDEEVSSIYSKGDTIKYMREKSKNAICFINGESSDGKKVTTSRKGIIRYRLNITGRAVHSARCFSGVSAITEAAYKIIELEKYKEETGITVNCGVIEGGTVANTVAEKCSFVADIRFATNSELEFIKNTVAEIARKSYIDGTSCEVEQISFRPPMERIPGSVALFNRLNEICAKYGFAERTENYSFGGSDAAYITQMGIPALDSMGIVSDRIHSVGECAELDSIAKQAKLYCALAIEL